MSNTKSKHATLIFDGPEAFMEKIRQEKMEKALAAELAYFSKNFDSLYEMVEPETVTAVAATLPLQDRLHSIFAAIDDAFTAHLSAIAAAVGLSPPYALQLPRAFDAVPDAPSARAALAKQSTGAAPDWLLWPPIQTDPASSKWEFYLDWFATSSPPEQHPPLALLLNGEETQAVALDTEDAGRFYFEMQCNKPKAFALAQDEFGALRLDIQTD